jgi:hypothetical protein
MEFKDYPLHIQLLAEQLGARHRTPVSTVDHPKGVIVPGNPFMTDKLKDRDYVPYCSKCTLCYRLRRTSFGFECPNCHNKANFDLTPFNDNINVQYEKVSDEIIPRSTQ